MGIKGSVLIAAVMLAGTFSASATVWPAACGSDSVQFKVKVEKKQPLPGSPEAGKAQIVFIEDVDGDFSSPPTARFGVDGSWVGADRGPSYFSISVAPGQYHLCASRQASVKADKDTVGVATVNAQADHVYYYEFKIARLAVGSLNRADGGGSGAGGLLPSTPNMTAREPETMDQAYFSVLSDVDAVSKLRKAALAKSEPKS